MRGGIFKRILLLYLVTSLIAIIGLGFYLSEVVGDYYLANLKAHLRDKAVLVAYALKKGDYAKTVEDLSRAAAARITLIQRDGTVAADSWSDPRTMANHGGRPEIRAAMSTGSGSAIRRSTTVNQDMFYLAHRVDPQSSRVAVVRLALPLRDVHTAISRLRIRVVAAVTLVFAGIGIFSALQIRKLRSITSQIARFSGTIASGTFDKRLDFSGFGEFDLIADHLNAMAAELKSTVARLKEEAARLNVILKSVPDALLIIDPDDRIVLSSAVSASFFEVDTVTNRAVETVVRSEEFSALLEAARTGGRAVVENIRLERPRERYWSVRISPFVLDARVEGHIAVFTDITRDVTLDQVRKDFVANASHEIKTPITAIKGFAETLLDGALDDPKHARKFIRTIEAHSERINRLVDDLMTISKIELGVMPIEKTTVDLRELVEVVVLTFEDKATAKGLAVHTWLREGIPEIRADRDRLIQILTNLVDNAVKFTDGGSITIGTGSDDTGPYLYVNDTGQGIPPEHLSRIGERFYRVDPSRSRQLGGTGLGLAIVKHLIKAHGWDWAIESSPGTGTRVKIYFA